MKPFSDSSFFWLIIFQIIHYSHFVHSHSGLVSKECILATSSLVVLPTGCKLLPIATKQRRNILWFLSRMVDDIELQSKPVFSCWSRYHKILTVKSPVSFSSFVILGGRHIWGQGLLLNFCNQTLLCVPFPMCPFSNVSFFQHIKSKLKCISCSNKIPLTWSVYDKDHMSELWIRNRREKDLCSCSNPLGASEFFSGLYLELHNRKDLFHFYNIPTAQPKYSWENLVRLIHSPHTAVSYFHS